MSRKTSIKRKAGDRNPPNITKLEILTLLLEGKKNTIEIREHLREILNITEKKNITKHLEELQNMNFISKVKGTSGFADSYYLKEDYTTLKNLFTFFDSQDHGLEFLKSSYAQNSINDSIINDIAIDLSEIIRPSRLILFLYKSEMNMSEIEKAIKTWNYPKDFQQQALSILETIKKRSNLTQLFNDIVKDNAYIEILKIYDSYQKYVNAQQNFDKLNEYLTEMGIEIFAIQSNRKIGGIKTSAKLLIPLEERNDLIKLLKTSPSALKFVIGLNNPSLKDKVNISIPYLQLQKIILNLVLEILHKIDIKKVKPEKCLQSIKNSFSNKKIIPTPLMYILKANMVIDIFQNRFVETDWLWDQYSNIFLSGGE